MAMHATLREMYGVLLEEREPHGDAKFAVQQLTGLTMTVGRLMGAMPLRWRDERTSESGSSEKARR